ncbi:MAG TPA: XdhC family protein [Blastocatellia bacterium]|nr:XdhC family protein [Blastocatellia bacterium]
MRNGSPFDECRGPAESHNFNIFNPIEWCQTARAIFATNASRQTTVSTVSISSFGNQSRPSIIQIRNYHIDYYYVDMSEHGSVKPPGGPLSAGEIYVEMKDRLDAGARAAMATVVKTRGSTPQQCGAKMVVFDDGSFIGTVGGGCVEADIWADAREVLRTGRSGIFHFNLAGDIEDDEGMVCGGQMDVLIEPWGMQEPD